MGWFALDFNTMEHIFIKYPHFYETVDIDEDLQAKIMQGIANIEFKSI